MTISELESRSRNSSPGRPRSNSRDLSGSPNRGSPIRPQQKQPSPRGSPSSTLTDMVEELESVNKQLNDLKQRYMPGSSPVTSSVLKSPVVQESVYSSHSQVSRQSPNVSPIRKHSVDHWFDTMHEEDQRLTNSIHELETQKEQQVSQLKQELHTIKTREIHQDSVEYLKEVFSYSVLSIIVSVFAVLIFIALLSRDHGGIRPT